MRIVLGLLLMAGVALLIRSTALSVLAARGVILDVLGFVVVLWSLRYGETWGSTFGFVLGLGADLDAAHWLGRHALALALIGYAVGRLSRAVVRDNPVTQLVLLFAATVIHQLWTLGFEFGVLHGWPLLLQRVAVSALVTAPFGVLLLALMRHGSGQPLFCLAADESGPRP
ncbi:MAG: rod shape-determining protein MreD [Candidatus Eisenbacteria bacterium]|nr:rod shape-determining protein MreD [Candidatus Eisenbacteria bacterium]